MKAKFYLGPKDGAEVEVQTSKGFAPELYQHTLRVGTSIATPITDNLPEKPTKIAYYDLQEVKEGIAYYKYRCTT